MSNSLYIEEDLKWLYLVSQAIGYMSYPISHVLEKHGWVKNNIITEKGKLAMKCSFQFGTEYDS